THISPNTCGINQAGNGITKLHVFVANGVAADYGAARLGHFRQSTAKDLFQNFKIALCGKGYDRECRDRSSAHGVNVAERVGRCNLAKRERLINNRSEEVDCLNQRHSRAETIYAGIITGLEANQDIL